jgi:membrane protease YdiL (CAAX protease family)
VAVPRDPAAALQAEPALSRLLDPPADPEFSGSPDAAPSPAATLAALDRRSVVVLVVAAGCLFGARFGQDARPDDWGRLAELSFWAGTQILFYGIVPLIAAKVLLGLSPGSLGIRVRGTFTHAWIYAALFAAAVPFVLVASTTSGFQERYPLLEVPLDGHVYPALALWWGWYALQFFAVETFFRGFLVHGLAPRLGWLSVVVAMVPYVMIHFVKPAPEALAAIVGGLVMGYLALRTGSIVWGVALHISVAALMDVSSLWHRGLLW